MDFWYIQKIKNGELKAVDDFIRKYYSSIFKYCVLRINKIPDAEDITQEVFIKFFQNIQQYHHYGKALNYLYVIAGNTCKDFYKRKRFSTEDINEYRNQLSEKAMDFELKLDMERALNQMPEELKEVAILFYFQGLKQREIAKILEIHLSLVKYRVARVKQLLSEYFKEEA